MARNKFNTVPEELLATADLAASHLHDNGYTVQIERGDLGCPYTPTLRCRRLTTTMYVEVDSEVRRDRLTEWVAFGKSAGQDTRLVLVVKSGTPIDDAADEFLRSAGIGLWVVGDGVVERIDPQDLALGVQLPHIRALPKPVRAMLGPAYDQFRRTNWREGFEEACQSVEAEARRYLKAGLRTGRVTIVSRKGATLTPTQVDGMTLGKLADTFAKIQNQNRVDSLLAQTLKSLNRDRIGVAHHKRTRRTEQRLRQNVGRHMWSVVNLLKAMHS